MKTRFARLISILLVFVMLFDCVPAGMLRAMAEEAIAEDRGQRTEDSGADTLTLEESMRSDRSDPTEGAEGEEASGVRLQASGEEEPVVEAPVVEEPVVEAPVVEEPVVEKNVVEEPTVEEPVVEEPVVEEPTVEESVVEEPVVEEPTVEESVVEEPMVEGPVVEEPVVKEEDRGQRTEDREETEASGENLQELGEANASSVTDGDTSLVEGGLVVVDEVEPLPEQEIKEAVFTPYYIHVSGGTKVYAAESLMGEYKQVAGGYAYVRVPGNNGALRISFAVEQDGEKVIRGGYVKDIGYSAIEKVTENTDGLKRDGVYYPGMKYIEEDRGQRTEDSGEDALTPGESMRSDRSDPTEVAEGEETVGEEGFEEDRGQRTEDSGEDALTLGESNTPSVTNGDTSLAEGGLVTEKPLSMMQPMKAPLMMAAPQSTDPEGQPEENPEENPEGNPEGQPEENPGKDPEDEPEEEKIDLTYTLTRDDETVKWEDVTVELKNSNGETIELTVVDEDNILTATTAEKVSKNVAESYSFEVTYPVDFYSLQNETATSATIVRTAEKITFTVTTDDAELDWNDVSVSCDTTDMKPDETASSTTIHVYQCILPVGVEKRSFEVTYNAEKYDQKELTEYSCLLSRKMQNVTYTLHCDNEDQSTLSGVSYLLTYGTEKTAEAAVSYNEQGDIILTYTIPADVAETDINFTVSANEGYEMGPVDEAGTYHFAKKIDRKFKIVKPDPTLENSYSYSLEEDNQPVEIQPTEDADGIITYEGLSFYKNIDNKYSFIAPVFIGYTLDGPGTEEIATCVYNKKPTVEKNVTIHWPSDDKIPTEAETLGTLQYRVSESDEWQEVHFQNGFFAEYDATCDYSEPITTTESITFELPDLGAMDAYRFAPQDVEGYVCLSDMDDDSSFTYYDMENVVYHVTWLGAEPADATVALQYRETGNEAWLNVDGDTFLSRFNYSKAPQTDGSVVYHSLPQTGFEYRLNVVAPENYLFIDGEAGNLEQTWLQETEYTYTFTQADGYPTLGWKLTAEVDGKDLDVATQTGMNTDFSDLYRTTMSQSTQDDVTIVTFNYLPAEEAGFSYTMVPVPPAVAGGVWKDDATGHNWTFVKKTTSATMNVELWDGEDQAKHVDYTLTVEDPDGEKITLFENGQLTDAGQDFFQYYGWQDFQYTRTETDESPVYSVTYSGLPEKDANGEKYSYTLTPKVPNDYADLTSTDEKPVDADALYVKLDNYTYTFKGENDGYYPTPTWSLSAKHRDISEQVGTDKEVNSAFSQKYGTSINTEEPIGATVTTVTVSDAPSIDAGYTYTMEPDAAPGGHWELDTTGYEWTFVKDTTSATMNVELWDGEDRAKHVDYTLKVEDPDSGEIINLFENGELTDDGRDFLPGYGWTDFDNTRIETDDSPVYSVTYSGLPQKNAEGHEYIYSFTPTMPAGYALPDKQVPKFVDSESTDKDDFFYIKTGTLTVQKTWYDHDAQAARPSKDHWVGSSEGYGLDGKYYESDSVSYDLQTKDPAIPGYYSITGDDTWTLEVTTYGFTGPNEPSKPYVKESKAELSQNDQLGKYDIQHTNKLYTDINTEGKLYDGDVSSSTIHKQRGVVITKHWKDGYSTDRPTVSFRLFRYAGNDAGKPGMFANMFPVEGYDSKKVEQLDWEWKNGIGGETGVFIYAPDEALPVYDSNGYKYIYVLRENLNGAGYTLVDDQQEPVYYFTVDEDRGIELFNSKGVPMNGNTLVNLRTGSTAASYIKQWDAKAIQNMKASVTFNLMRKLMGADDSTWEVLQEAKYQKTLEFRAEYMTKSGSFDGLAQFDTEGQEYEYKVVETAMSIQIADPDTGDLHAPIVFELKTGESFFGNDVYTQNGLSVVVDSTVDEEGNTKIINRIQQNVTLNMKKDWDPDLAEGDSGLVTVQIKRNGIVLTDTDLQGITLNAGAILEDNQISMQMTKDQTINVGGLPQYDPNGGEYVYEFDEVNKTITTTNGVEYHYSHTSFNNQRDENTRQLTVNQTVTNYHGGGDSIHVNVRKVWNDDGNVSSRLPVWFSLYYEQDDGTFEPLKVDGSDHIEIKEENQWVKDFYYDLKGRENNTDRFVVKELGMGSWIEEKNAPQFPVGKVEMKAKNEEGNEVVVETIAQGIETNEHYYQSSVSSDGYNYTMTNTRKGTLSIVLTKYWNTGDLENLRGEITGDDQEGLTPKFLLHRNGKPYEGDKGEAAGVYKMETYKPNQGPATTVLRIPNLPKYDEDGKLYNYSLKEMYLNTAAFVDNEIVCEHFNILSSSKDGSYEVGSKHSGDIMSTEFTNTRRKTTPLSIQKLWRDDGTNRRPDISLQLYRESTKLKDANSADATRIVADITWSTGNGNGWLWDCSFGSYPLYDGDGYAYNYYVKENLYGNSRYQKYYYTGTLESKLSGIGKKNTIEVLSDAESMEPLNDVNYPYIVKKAENQTYAEVKNGLIINRIEEKIFFNGKKLWENIPGWLDRSEWPTVWLNVQQSYASPRENMQRLAWSSPVELGPDGNYTVHEEVDVYDEYGLKYGEMKLVEVTQNNEIKTLFDYTVTEDGNYVVKNTYSGTEKLITFDVQKTWNMEALKKLMFADMAEKTLKYPAVTFELHQLYQFPEGSEYISEFPDTVVGKAHLDSETIQESHAENEYKHVPITFHTIDADGNETNVNGQYPVYVPMGIQEPAYCFTYYIVETVDGNENASVYKLDNNGVFRFEGAGTRALEDDGKGIFVLTNQYNPLAQNDRTATKIWVGDDDFYTLTRPANRAANGPMKLELWRSQNINGELVEEQVNNWDDSALWEDSGNDKWIFTFAGKNGERLPEYGPNNLPYTYYVKEASDAAIRTVYTEKTEPDLMTLKNELKTVSVSEKKTWKITLADGTVLTDWNDTMKAVLGDLRDFWNLTDVYLTFTVSDEQGVMQLLKGKTGYANPQKYSYLNDQLYTGNGQRLFEQLPEYVFSGTGDQCSPVKVEYAVQETDVFAVPVEFSNENKEKPDYSGAAGTVFDVTGNTAQTDATNKIVRGTVTNSADVNKLTVNKIWNDGNNQDGLRPHELTIMVSPNQSSGKAVTKKLEWNDNDTGTDNSQNIVFYFPVSLAREGSDYTVTESNEKLSVYTSAYTVNSGTPNDDAVANVDMEETENTVLTFINTYTPKKIDLSVTKAWVDKDNLFANRPTNVQVKLQRRIVGSSDAWEDCYQDAVILNDNNEWKYTWNSQTVYRVKDMTERIYTSDLYEYRVLEVSNFASYTSDSPRKYDFTVDDKADAVTITNTSVMTDNITAEKVWVDSSNQYNINFRPGRLVLTLMKSTDEQNWTVVRKAGVAVQTVLSGAGDTWSWDIGTLPVNDTFDNGKTILYRVNEYPVYDSETTDDEAKEAALTAEVVPNGYGYTAAHTDLTATENTDGTIRVTNTLIRQNLNVTKQWNDDDFDSYKLRKSVTIGLYYKIEGQDDSAYQPLKLKAADVRVTLNAPDWNSSFANVPVTDRENQKIVYQAREISEHMGYTYGRDVVFGDSKSATLENTLDLGKVTLKKTVVGDDDGGEFEFNIKMEAPDSTYPSESVYRTYSYTGSKSGTVTINAQNGGTIKLKKDETVTIEGIVAGTTVTVSEDASDRGFVTTYTGNDAVIEKDKTKTIEVTNERHVGTFTLSKELGGNAGLEDTFYYTLELGCDKRPLASDYSKALIATGYFNKGHTYNGITFTPVNGVPTAEVSLTVSSTQPKPSLTLSGLPYGSVINVYEHDANQTKKTVTGLKGLGYEIKTVVKTVFSPYDPDYGQGQIVDKEFQDVNLKFINERNVGSIKLSKELNGTGTKADTIFTFDVMLTFAKDIDLQQTANLPIISKGSDTITISEPVHGVSEDEEPQLRYSVTMKGGEWIQLNNVLVDTKYAITEADPKAAGFLETKINGAENADRVATGTVSTAGNTYTNAYVNIRNAGSLTVSKVVTGNAANVLTDYSMNVTLTYPNGVVAPATIKAVRTDAQGVSTNEVVFTTPNQNVANLTFKLKGGESLKLTDIDVGTRYKVTETGAREKGYDVAYTAENGQITLEAPDPCATVSNTRRTGTVAVQKQTNGSGRRTDDSFQFTVKLTYASGIDVTLFDNKPVVMKGNTAVDPDIQGQTLTYTASLQDQEALTLSNVLLGTKYQVKEYDYSTDGYRTEITEPDATNHPGIESYESTLSVDDGVNHDSNFQVVKYTNTRSTGSIILKKELGGTGNKANKKDVEFTFEVKLTYPNGINLATTGNNLPTINLVPAKYDRVVNNQVVTYTIRLKGAESATISDIVVYGTGANDGVSYTITETESHADEGFLKTMVNGTETKTVSGTIKTNASDNHLTCNADTQTFTNIRNAGSLTVSKVVTGNAANVLTDYSMNVTLTYPNGVDAPATINAVHTDAQGVSTNEVVSTTPNQSVANLTFTLKGGESLKLTDIDVGTRYKVTETGAREMGYDVAYTAGNGQITLEAPDPCATVSNTRRTGTVAVQKQTNGSGRRTDDSFQFTVKLTYASGIDVTLFDNKPVVMKGNTTVDPDIQGQTLTYTASLQDQETLTLSNVLLGTKYQVKENDYSTDGYRTEITEPNDTKHPDIESYESTLSVDDGVNHDSNFQVVKYTNTRSTGSIILKKELDGTGNKANKKDVEFTFEVKLTYPNGINLAATGNNLPTIDLVPAKYDRVVNNQVVTYTIRLKGDESATISDIVVYGTGANDGVSYTITETESHADEGFLKTMANGTETKTVSGTVKTNASDNHLTCNADTQTFTNIRNAGSLTVSKDVTGNAANVLTDYVMNVTLTYPEGVNIPASINTNKVTVNGNVPVTLTPVQGKVTFNLKGGESLTLLDIDENVDYVVAEDNYRKYDYNTTYDDYKTGTISSGVESETTVTNNRIVGTIEVKKVVSGTGLDLVEDFAFELVLTYEKDIDLTQEENLPVIDVQDTEVERSIDRQQITYTTTLSNGKSLKLSNVLVGTTYTVEEEDYKAEGFLETLINDKPSEDRKVSGTVEQKTDMPAGKDYSYIYTNIRNATVLTVAKRLKGNASDLGLAFNVTVTLDYPDDVTAPATIKTDHGTLETKLVGENDNVVTVDFALKGGEYLNLEDLVFGTIYAVEEHDYRGYDYNTTAFGDRGIIGGESNDQFVQIINDRTTGSIEVEKLVKGTGLDLVKDFTFELVLTYEDDIDLSLEENLPVIGEQDTEVSRSIEGQMIIYNTTLSNGKSLKLSNVLVGTVYTVEEADYKAEGFLRTEITEDRGQRTEGLRTSGKVEEEGKNYSQTYTNIRNAGELTVAKKLTGNASDLGLDYRMTVLLDYPEGVAVPESILTDKDELKTTVVTEEDNKATVTFTLKGGESLTLKDVVTGTTYAVTEDSYRAYDFTTTYRNEKGTIGSGEKEKQTGTVTNDRTTGSVEVKKLVKGTGLDLVKDFAFELVLTYEDDIDLTLEDNLPVIAVQDAEASRKVDGQKIIYKTTLSHGKSLKLNNVLVGTGYTVEEEDYKAEGFLRTEITEDRGQRTKGLRTSGKVEEEGKTYSQIYTNIRNAGELTVAKKLTGNASDLGLAYTMTVLLDYPDGVAVPESITTDKGELKTSLVSADDNKATVTFALKGGESLTLKDVVTGTTYEVSEDSYRAYDFTTTYRNEKGTIGSGAAEKQTATVTNDRTTANLTLTKKVAGSGTDRVKNFHFAVTLEYESDIDLTKEANLPVILEKDGEVEREITGQRVTYTTTLGNGKSLKLDNILIGTSYTVKEEANIAEGFLKTLIRNEAGKETEGYLAQGKAEIEKKAYSLTYTNIRNASDLDITKVLEGNNTDPDKLFTFHVTLKGADGTKPFAETASEKNGKDNGPIRFELSEDGTTATMTFELKGGETLRIKDITDGTTYTVTEDDYQQDGYLTEAKGQEGVIAAGGARCVYTNIRNHEELTVKKALQGNATKQGMSFSMTVTLHREDKVPIIGTYATADGKTVEFKDDGNGNAVAKINVPGNGSVKILGIPRDTEYKVTEADYRNEDYVTTYTDAQGKVPEGGQTVTVTNTRKAGDLTISKKVKVEGLKGYSSNREFTFTVRITKGDGTPLTRAMDAVRSDGTGMTVTFLNGTAKVRLKGGESLTILDIPEKAVYSVRENTYAGITTVATGSDGTMTTDGATALFVNTLTQASMDLTIRKEWDDGDDLDQVRPESITVKVTGGEENRIAELNAENHWTVTLTGLPRFDENGDNVIYNVTEAQVPQKYTASYKLDGATVVITNHHSTDPFDEEYITIDDYSVPVSTGLNMNEGYCFH